MGASGKILTCEGRTHFGWPWAKSNGADILTASEERLILSSRLGKINLRAATILRIERAGMFPCFGRGIMIHHRSRGYPAGIGFIPTKTDSSELLDQLSGCGYSVL
jgi:hypothetical protein